MGRTKNPLTGTQKDDEKFAAFTTELKAIGIRKLGTYGFLSHETINNYCRRMAVSPGSEDLIHESVKAYRNELKEIELRSVQKTQELLTA